MIAGTDNSDDDPPEEKPIKMHKRSVIAGLCYVCLVICTITRLHVHKRSHFNGVLAIRFGLM